MISKVKKTEKNLVELNIEFTAEEFVEALKSTYQHNAKRFSIPGFRKGKAPYALAMRYYGEGVLYDEAIDQLVNSAYSGALDEHNIDPVARPDMEVVKIGSAEGLEVILKIVTKPEVNLGEYKGVKAEKTDAVVTDEQVDAEVEMVRERSGRMVPVQDRSAADGDTAKIDFEGFVDGEAFEGGKGEGYDLKLGSGTFIPGFEEQIVGHNVEDEFDVNVTFPEDYAAKELAGKLAVFKCKLHSLMVKELPELDDEFAKDISEFDTLAEFKADLRQKLQTKADEKAKRDFEDNVIKAVVETAEVEIPEVMIEQEITGTIDRQTQTMRYQGIELNQYLQYIGKTLEEYRNEMREPATNQVKTSLVIEAITKKENLPISDEAFQAGIERIGKQYGMAKEDIEKRFGRDNEMINNMIRSQLTIDMLVNEAVPVASK